MAAPRRTASAKSQPAPSAGLGVYAPLIDIVRGRLAAGSPPEPPASPPPEEGSPASPEWHFRLRAAEEALSRAYAIDEDADNAALYSSGCLMRVRKALGGCDMKTSDLRAAHEALLDHSAGFPCEYCNERRVV